MKTFDLAIVGGGMLGIAHAYHAVQTGLKVVVVEKDARPRAATVRNFGQIVPSGMNAKWQAYGRESLRIYRAMQQQTDITVRPYGSVYIASNEEEMTLLEELAQINQDNDYESNLLTRAACLEQYPGLRGDYAIGGLFFPQEVTVDPRQAIHLITGLLQEQYGLTSYTHTLVTEIEKSGDQFQLINNQKLALAAKQVIVCSGSDFQTLFPKIFRESDLQSVKLQMLMTRPQPNQRIPGSVLTGWTIRRYESFQDCPSYAAIKAGEDGEAYQRKWGIHILFKQADDGRVILGDSHEYLDASNEQQFDYQLYDEVNAFMLQAAREIYNLQTYEIEKSWYGIYSQCKTQDIFEQEVMSGLHIVTGIGGKGMTGSFGFAKQKISSIL